MKKAFIAALVLITICSSAVSVLAGSGFGRKFSDFALAASAIPKVQKTHPRLFLRREPWQRGPSVTELRQWAPNQPLKKYLSQKPWNPQPGGEWAFRYLLTGDESLVQPIIDKMKQGKGYWPGYLTTLAVQYDWLYNSPSFTAADKKIIEDRIVSWAKGAIAKGEYYHDMWSHFGYAPVTDLAAAGLALYGHRPEAQRFLELAGGYLKKNLLPGWQLSGGAWMGGWAYYGQGAAKLISLVAMWSSATDEDLYQLIEQKQGDWLRKHLYFLLSTIYPDGSPMETTGFSYSPYRQGVLGSILKITRAYNDPAGIASLEGLKKMPWWAGAKQFMYYTPAMRASTGKQHPPLDQVWSRKGVGYAQFRSGWQKDDTVIDFKCGDYFWSHQFQNQGSFTIYHGGRLAIQSGIYDSYWGDHMQFYYRPTIGSNSVLIVKPGEVSWIPPHEARRHKVDADHNGFFKEFGGQRVCYILPEVGSAETCFSFDKYLYRKNHQHHFETGDITAWEVGDGYAYVSGDLTMAYNNPQFSYPHNQPKVSHVSRDLLFLQQKYLLVFDRINALDSSYEKRWLLHSIGEPIVQEEKIAEKEPGHLETYRAGMVRIDYGKGTLFCQTMFPGEYRLKKIGGSATMSEVGYDPGNRGNLRLTAMIKGKYVGMGTTIATDAAREENWTIEFLDAEKFKVHGSLSGDDGTGSLKKNFLSRSRSLFIPKANWQGKPQKGDLVYFLVTSTSHRFWVDGKNHLPSVGKLHNVLKDGSRVHPGNWRIEVVPERKSRFTNFLHLLYACNRVGAVEPRATGIKSSGDTLWGLMVDKQVVMFARQAALPKKTSYEINKKGRYRHLLLGLPAQRKFTVTITGLEAGSSSLKTGIVSSSEGVLIFTTSKPATVTINPQ